MATISDFLDHHTDEVVLLMLKQELTTSYDGDISADVNKIVNDGLGAKVYARNPEWRRWPRLGECRGRVVVLSRFKNPHASHSARWAGPTTAKMTR